MQKILVICLALLAFGCQKAEETKVETKPVASPTVQAKTEPTPNVMANKINVPDLANKSAAEFDKLFGKPTKISPATNPKEIPGEYRHYKIAGNEKGLSVRFFKDKAVRFNLFINSPANSAKDALLQTFGIDVKNAVPDTKTEPLSEKYKGVFNSVNFLTAYAKREKSNGQFVMVHAEVQP